VTAKLTSRPSGSGANSVRELQAAREIAQAFLTARYPTEVYRVALERVAPLVGASFGCVFLLDGGTDLLRVVAAYNWPQAHATHLSSMRVRVGNGPTGRAVAETTLVEVLDVFADPGLEDWWDAARELGFVSSVSVPLVLRERTIGAITFYFRRPETFHDADRNLLRLVADQLAATAEKAHLIDDLQRANEQLREQNVELEAKYREAEEARRLKNEFLANVSHELRTPLTAILGYAYLLREGLPGALGKEQLSAVARIEDAGTVLVSLINDLLDLTHLKLGRTQVEPELCDAVALARAALSAAPSPRPAVRVRSEAPAERVPIHTDPVLVQRILQNLLGNALKFTDEGTVVLRVRRVEPAQEAAEGGERAVASATPLVVWEVEDTGIGIAADHHEVIFQEFRQADGSATRRFGGVGLGLALSRALARRLGGDIRMRSEPERGSVFSLILPASVVHAGTDRPSPPSA
jgi:signal transduction histidine kinase